MTMISLHRYLFSKSSQLISFKVLASASHANNTYLPPAPTSNLRTFSAAPPNIEPTTRKRLDVAIAGLPNAGKSQLLNSLVGTKVAAVSRKRHTTRSGILAARTIENTQIVFVDTPGFMHHASTAREGVRQLAAHASSEMDEVDHVLLVMDGAKKLEADVKRAIVMLMFMALRSRGRREGGKSIELISQKQRSKFAVVVNKVDLVSPKEKLLGIAGEVGSMAESCIRVLLEQRRSQSKVKLGDLVNHVVENHMDEQGFDGVHDDDVELFATLTPEFHFTRLVTD
jgi:GTP-binding protein Era